MRAVQGSGQFVLSSLGQPSVSSVMGMPIVRIQTRPNVFRIGVRNATRKTMVVVETTRPFALTMACQNAASSVIPPTTMAAEAKRLFAGRMDLSV